MDNTLLLTYDMYGNILEHIYIYAIHYDKLLYLDFMELTDMSWICWVEDLEANPRSINSGYPVVAGAGP